MLPEQVIREIAGRKFGMEPEKVTDHEVELVATDLCRHYESFRMKPISEQIEEAVSCDPQFVPVADAAFWSDCEEQFRKYHEGENRLLWAVWHSTESAWHFMGEPAASPLAIECFKSLAREAAKGLGKAGDGTWSDWLDSLRVAKEGQPASRSTQK